MRKSLVYPKSPRSDNSVINMDLNQPLRSKLRFPGEILPQKQTKFLNSRSSSPRSSSPRIPFSHNSVNIKPPPLDTRNFILLQKGQNINPRRSFHSVHGPRAFYETYGNNRSNPSFNSLEDLTPSMSVDQVQQHWQKLKEDQLDEWINTYKPSPMKIIDKISKISEQHSSILERIMTELESLGPLYEHHSEEESEYDDEEEQIQNETKIKKNKKQRDEELFNLDPEKYFQASIASIDKQIHGDESMTAGTDDVPYANTNIDTVETITNLRLKMRDMLEEKDSLDNEIQNLKQELAQAKYKNKLAKKDYDLYSSIISKQTFDFFPPSQANRTQTEEEESDEDLDRILKKLERRERGNEDEEEEETDEENEEPKLTKEQKLKRIYNYLYGEQSHLRYECRLYEGRIAEHHKQQLEICDRAAKRKFEIINASKKKK